MVQIFAKRVWGFVPERWPVITFHHDGNRNALVNASRPGDLVLFVGTEGDETAPEDRGRLLGLAEIGRNCPVDTRDAVDPTILKPEHFDENSEIRWPKALAMLRAWRVKPAPRLRDVLAEQLTYEATVRGVLLDAADTGAVLALPMEEASIRDCPAISRLRLMNDALQGATTGPRPSSWLGESGRDASEPSFTYAFQFGQRTVWKIGHAKDVAARLAEICKHIPQEVLGENWQPGFEQRWPDEGKAYDMEQRLLTLLRTPECVGERVLCTRAQLKSAWMKALVP